jgi:hypothetical protein
MSPMKLWTWLCTWRIPSWTLSFNSGWCHKSFSVAGLWCSSDEKSARSWRLFPRLTSWFGIEVTCQHWCVSSGKCFFRLQLSFMQVVWWVCCWDWLPCFWLPATGVVYSVGIQYWLHWDSHVLQGRFGAHISLLPSDKQHLINWLLLAMLNSGLPEIAHVLVYVLL